MTRSLADRVLDGSHAHRWQIEPPHGPTSMGYCSCGESREFINELVPTLRRPKRKTPVFADDLEPTPEALAEIESEEASAEKPALFSVKSCGKAHSWCRICRPESAQKCRERWN
jgi:hypothetical protein